MTVRYTRELLTALAAESCSVNDMMRRLGVPMAGGTHTYLSRRIKHYGIDTSHFNQGRPDYGRHRYSRERLAEAAAHSTSIGAMLRFMGVEPYDSAYSYLKQRLAEFGIDTSHFSFRGAADEPLPREALAAAATASRSVIGVVRALGLPETNASRRKVADSIAHHRIRTGHFTGQAHNRGRRTGPRLKPHELLRRLPEGSNRIPGRPPAGHAAAHRPPGPLRDVRHSAHLARSADDAGGGPRQRRLAGQPGREPAPALPELPLRHPDLLRPQSARPDRHSGNLSTDPGLTDGRLAAPSACTPAG
jgi:hypothetical protein